MLNRIDAELTRLADNQMLTNKWILFEKAIEATVVDKKINTKLHIEYAIYCLIETRCQGWPERAALWS